jgi:hypothetical protein
MTIANIILIFLQEKNNPYQLNDYYLKNYELPDDVNKYNLWLNQIYKDYGDQNTAPN